MRRLLLGKCARVAVPGLLLIFVITSVFAQEQYDIQKIRILKSELWALLESEGLVTPIDPKNLTEDQEKTLASIKQVNEYPIYTMTYYGDYGFDEYLKTGLPVDGPNISLGEGCSCFAALNEKGNKIYGRNLDLTHLYPVLILFTDSPHGYAAVSLHGALDIELYLGDPTNEEYIQWVLQYPYWPFDGMNEYGVTISGLNVPGETVFDPNKITISRYEIRRLVLEHARNVEEAIALIEEYNCSTSHSVHYLLSDAYGNSAVIEYYDGQVHAHRNVEPWQVATNFLVKGREPEQLLGECWRYTTVYPLLLAHNGVISRWTGMNILSSVWRKAEPVSADTFVYTVYSGIYDMTEGWLEISPGENKDNFRKVRLDMVNDLSLLKAKVNAGPFSAGDRLKAAVTVKNRSPRPSKKTHVHFYLSKKKKIDDNAICLGRKKLRSLDFNKKKVLRFNKNINLGIEAGSYYFVAVVDPKELNNDPSRKDNILAVKKRLIVD
jgi:hypothetical protein